MAARFVKPRKWCDLLLPLHGGEGVLELLRVGHELEHPLVLLDVPFLGFTPAAQPPCLIPTVIFFQGSWSFVVLAGSVDYFICDFFVMNS